MDKNLAKQLLEKTRQDYNLIAKDFSRTRQFLWQDLKPLAKYSQEGDRVLDLGCGNGRLVELFQGKAIEYFGVDNSEELIKIANTKYQIPNTKYKFLVADALNLPFSDSFFDKVFSIAVLHHIPSKDLRLQFLKEIKRILKPNGQLILTVWNLWRRETAWGHLLKNLILKLIGRSKLDFKDILYSWKNSEGKVVVQRYYHLFTKSEIKKLVETAGFRLRELRILEREKGRGNNILLIAENSKSPTPGKRD